jgi:hypothetical protein
MDSSWCCPAFFIIPVRKHHAGLITSGVIYRMIVVHQKYGMHIFSEDMDAVKRKPKRIRDKSFGLRDAQAVDPNAEIPAYR